MRPDPRDLQTDFTDEATLMLGDFPGFQEPIFNEEAALEAIAMQVDDCYNLESAMSPDLHFRGFDRSTV
jgi:hypothetical protein